jgi:hypothetical protein
MNQKLFIRLASLFLTLFVIVSVLGLSGVDQAKAIAESVASFSGKVIAFNPVLSNQDTIQVAKPGPKNQLPQFGYYKDKKHKDDDDAVPPPPPADSACAVTPWNSSASAGQPPVVGFSVNPPTPGSKCTACFPTKGVNDAVLRRLDGSNWNPASNIWAKDGQFCTTVEGAGVWGLFSNR